MVLPPGCTAVGRQVENAVVREPNAVHVDGGDHGAYRSWTSGENFLGLAMGPSP